MQQTHHIRKLTLKVKTPTPASGTAVQHELGMLADDMAATLDRVFNQFAGDKSIEIDRLELALPNYPSSDILATEFLRDVEQRLREVLPETSAVLSSTALGTNSGDASEPSGAAGKRELVREFLEHGSLAWHQEPVKHSDLLAYLLDVVSNDQNDRHRLIQLLADNATAHRRFILQFTNREIAEIIAACTEPGSSSRPPHDVSLAFAVQVSSQLIRGPQSSDRELRIHAWKEVVQTLLLDKITIPEQLSQVMDVLKKYFTTSPSETISPAGLRRIREHISSSGACHDLDVPSGRLDQEFFLPLAVLHKQLIENVDNSISELPDKQDIEKAEKPKTTDRSDDRPELRKTQEHTAEASDEGNGTDTSQVEMSRSREISTQQDAERLAMRQNLTMQESAQRQSPDGNGPPIPGDDGQSSQHLQTQEKDAALPGGAKPVISTSDVEADEQFTAPPSAPSHESPNPSSLSRSSHLSIPYFDTDTAPRKEYFINNAGLVLAGVLFSTTFKNLGYLKEKKFRNDESLVQAIQLTQYVVNGSESSVESDLVLNKIICGLEPQTPIDLASGLTDKEKNEVTELLDTIIQYWTALKRTSHDGLREGFLRRDGILSVTENGYLLRVERKTQDILLDSMPWSYDMIKHSWMKQPITVEW